MRRKLRVRAQGSIRERLSALANLRTRQTNQFATGRDRFSRQALEAGERATAVEGLSEADRAVFDQLLPIQEQIAGLQGLTPVGGGFLTADTDIISAIRNRTQRGANALANPEQFGLISGADRLSQLQQLQQQQQSILFPGGVPNSPFERLQQTILGFQGARGFQGGGAFQSALANDPQGQLASLGAIGLGRFGGTNQVGVFGGPRPVLQGFGGLGNLEEIFGDSFFGPSVGDNPFVARSQQAVDLTNSFNQLLGL